MKKLLLFPTLLLMASILFGQMPNAITIEPPGATAYNEITLTFDPVEACFENGSLEGLPYIAIHSGVCFINGDTWQNIVNFDDVGMNGQPTTLMPTGDGKFAITFIPQDYYGFPEGSIVTELCAVFNNGSGWSDDGRDFKPIGEQCMDFFIPIHFSGDGKVYVPGDFPDIQTGIDQAVDGDIIIVDTGTYFENINFRGKAITVASHFILDADTNHINNTIIDGSQPTDTTKGSVVTFDSGEDTTSVLIGFTITGGTGTYISQHNSWSGAGIQCFPAGAKIMNNKIINNTINSEGSGYGAGILCDHEDAGWIVIDDNVIGSNSINSVDEAFGAGLSIFGKARIENNEVTDNLAFSLTGISGGGINCKGTFYDPSFKELRLTNNLIKNNTANSQSTTTEGAYFGGLYVEGYYGTVLNNTIIGNSVSAYDGQVCYAPGFMSIRNPDSIIVENNIIQGNYFTSGVCWGGGICVWMGGGVYRNNIIQENQASKGGGMYINTDETPLVINNTITGNEATTHGGGLYIKYSNAVILNSILWGNTSLYDSSICVVGDTILKVRYSNIEGEKVWPGKGNLVLNPEFKEDGYHLSWSSMIVNQGIDSIEIDGIWFHSPLNDIDGDERPYMNTLPDMGADEAAIMYVDIPETNTKSAFNIQAFPNPFSNSTTLAYELTQNSFVITTIYNQLGKQIEVIQQKQSVGKQQVTWNASGIPAGVYYCVLKTENRTQTVKMIKLNY